MPTVAPLPENIEKIVAQLKVPDANGGTRSLTAEEAAAEVLQRSKFLRWSEFSNLIGKRYQTCRFDGFEIDHEAAQRAVDRLQDFAAKFSASAGRGVVFLGPRGSGKDHLAVATVRECIRSGDVSAGWVDGQSLFAQMRERIHSEESELRRINELVKPQILLISDPVPADDKLSTFQQSTLWQIIDRRYRECRSTWITANAASEGELSGKMGAQLVDRISDDALVIVTTGWKSYRTPGEIVK